MGYVDYEQQPKWGPHKVSYYPHGAHLWSHPWPLCVLALDPTWPSFGLHPLLDFQLKICMIKIFVAAKLRVRKIGLPFSFPNPYPWRTLPIPCDRHAPKWTPYGRTFTLNNDLHCLHDNLGFYFFFFLSYIFNFLNGFFIFFSLFITLSLVAQNLYLIIW